MKSLLLFSILIYEKQHCILKNKDFFKIIAIAIIIIITIFHFWNYVLKKINFISYTLDFFTLLRNVKLKNLNNLLQDVGFDIFQDWLWTRMFARVWRPAFWQIWNKCKWCKIIKWTNTSMHHFLFKECVRYR